MRVTLLLCFFFDMSRHHSFIRPCAMLQVSEKLYLKEKKNASLEEVRDFVGLALHCWAICQEAKPQRSLCEKLDATCLAADETLSWLESLCEGEAPKLLSLVEAVVRKQTAELEKQLAELALLPSLQEERKYRDFLATRSTSWARTVSTMSTELSTVQSTLQLLSTMAERLRSELIERDLLDAWQRHARQWDGVAQTLSSHVTWFACLTLFRSPLVGGTSSDAKSTTQKLQGVLGTWLQSNWPKAPPSSTFPKDILDATLRDMVAAVAWQ